MTNALLEIDDLAVSFSGRRGHVRAVQNVSLTVGAGEILGIVGESGAGKSTIGAAILGLIEPPGRIETGKIRLNGDDLTDLTSRQWEDVRGRRIGMIMQDPLTSLNPLYTIEKHLVETIHLTRGVPVAQAKGLALGLLQSVGIPDPELRLSQYPHQFSGGMRQRVVIALALCGEPELVIADEPTTALDVSIQAQILQLIREQCRQRQTGVILITHNMGVIAEITDRVAVMYQGQVVETGSTQQILGAPVHDYTKSLISAVPRVDLKVTRFPQPIFGLAEATQTITDEPQDVKVDWLTARDRKSPPGEASAFAMLRIDQLSKSFVIKNSWIPSQRRSHDAVKTVSFDIQQGEIFGLVGESGCGKSTIARMISGLHTPDSGRMIFEGQTLGDEDHRSALGIQMIFQDPFSSLNPRWRVRELVSEPLRYQPEQHDRAETDSIVRQLLLHVGLPADVMNRFPHEFSGGQRQRISIARALASRPRFLICDEPTSALDVSIQAQILNLLKDLRDKYHLTILFISHDLPVIRQMCDRIGVMKAGELCELSPARRLFEEPEHPYTQSLLSMMPPLDALSREGLDVLGS